LTVNINDKHFYLIIEFKIDDKIKAGIKQAQINYKQSTSNIQLKNFELDYGRTIPKKYKLSPDSLMQSGYVTFVK
jgi:hypothetical protein